VSPSGSATLHELPEPLARAIESAAVPALPQALLRLLQLADDDTTSIAEMARIVEQDPGLCARIIAAANSPGLRRGQALASIDHCLTSLGTRLIRSIATCLSLQGMFERRHETTHVDLSAFWRHSIATAEAARELAAETGYPRPGEAYLAGLLHDVGELLLLTALGGTYAQVLAAAADESALEAIERERLGTHHGEVGSWLVDRWDLDLALGDAILFHHVDAEAIATAWTLPQVVWLAHRLSASPQADAATASLATRLFGDSLAERLPAIATRARLRTDRLAEALNLGRGETSGEAGAGTARALPIVRVNATSFSEGDAEGEIESAMRDLAMMQPLQRDLFGVESEFELLRSLRESARILFDLGRMTFFLRNPDDDRLSAAHFGEQPALLRYASIRVDAPRCLVAAAAASQRIASSYDADYPQPPALIDLQFARVLDSEGLLCVPMNGRARNVGVMVFGLSRAQHQRLQKRLPRLLGFGRVAALSLEAWHEAIRYRRQAAAEASAQFEQQARRLVHEAGNPLGIIRSYLKILDGKLPQDASIREEIGVLREEIDRVSSIVRRLKEIPATPADAAGLDAVAVIRELLAFYDEALFKAHGVSVEFSATEPVERVQCSRDSLKQILLNLWKNAAEAMPGGGRILIGVEGGIVQDGRRHVAVTIADDGPGMPPEILARLTGESAQTPAGERGMGLSIVAALTRQAGAILNCRTRRGSGTTFTLLLPCAGSVPIHSALP
jgi:HD-like signal output (HDOD) protein/signal transduction histidine kinase